MPNARLALRLLALAAILVLAIGSADGWCQGPRAAYVWAESDGERIELYFSRFAHGDWEPPQPLTNNRLHNLHPALAEGPDSRLWLVWTGMEGLHNRIYFAIYDDQRGWTHPEEVDTGMISAVAPTIAFDGQGTPWIAWAGYAGRNDDIYVCRWRDDGWSPPHRIHPANDVPDVLPEIRYEDGRLSVRFQRFDGDVYRTYASVFDGRRWSTPREVETGQAQLPEGTKTAKAASASRIPAPPAFAHPVGKDAMLAR